MVLVIILLLVVFVSPGVVAKGVEDKKNSLHMIDTIMENMEDRLTIRDSKGEYISIEGEGRADELSMEAKRYQFISAYLNRRLLREGAEKSSSKSDMVRNISSDDPSEKYSLSQGGKREDHLRNNSMEEDFEGNEDKDGEYSDNVGREEGKARKYPADDEREKNLFNNKCRVEDHTKSWGEDHHQGNRGEGKEYSDYEGREREDWEKYFQTNRDKEEEPTDKEDQMEGFQTGDKSVSDPTNEIEEEGNQPRKTAEEIAKWAENTIQNAAGEHLVEKRSPEDCESGGDPCGAIPGNGTLDSSVGFRDHSSTLWPFGSKTGYPLVPYRILVKDPEIVRLLEDSISEWNSATCIDFVKVTPENEKALGTWEYLNFVSHPIRCLFRFGKEEGKSQTLFVHKSCQTKEEIVRGLGIGLGIHYQFLRPDRDDHLRINADNANDEFPKFQVEELAESNVPFDYLSVMQPSGVWYSKDGKMTFSTKDIKYQGLLGRSRGSISHRDKLIVNKLYGCLDRWRSSCGFRKDPCKNEGYIGPKCVCICRHGIFGSVCANVEIRDYYDSKLPLCSEDIRAETTIETPNYEDQFIQNDTWCVWNIQAPKGKVVKLKFDSFSLEKSGRHCEESFLEIRQKNESFGNVYCGEDLNQEEEIISVDNELNLYLDVRNNVSKGFRASVSFLSIPGVVNRPLVPSLASRLRLCSTYLILVSSILVCLGLLDLF